jgi:hypothetical protein
MQADQLIMLNGMSQDIFNLHMQFQHTCVFLINYFTVILSKRYAVCIRLMTDFVLHTEYSQD